MEPSIIFEIIGTVGLPVALCVWYVFQAYKDKQRLYNVIDSFGEQMGRFNDTLITIDKRLETLEETE